MALTDEWRDRIDLWRKELPNHFYRPLGQVRFSGFSTREQLKPREAQGRRFRPMNPGVAWGGKWEYGWFKTDLVLPREAAGQRIVLNSNVGGDGIIWVDGKVAGARDWARPYHTLSRRGRPGQRFRVLLETYAGHGPAPEKAGPTPPELPSVLEPPPTQQTVGKSSFGIWDEEAYGLWLDAETLWHLRESVDANSLRQAEIDKALCDFAVIVDFELPQPERRATFLAARKRLRPLLECVNGSTAGKEFAFGHGHLDVAWLWPLAETERKVARTFSNQLNLVAEYPDYKFIQSQPHLYRMCQRLYPELYERVRRAVRSGGFIAEGGMWVEADTNITSGESLIRQFVHGKRFFREEFGVTSRMLWLPDVFGYSGALPQIMRGCGVLYFGTAKLFWLYHNGEPYPADTFTWEGIDGSCVRTHLVQCYSGDTNPRDIVWRWNRRLQKDMDSTMCVYGHGDGGGGPTREHVEFLCREADLEGIARVKMAGPVEFFEDREAQGWPKARYVGELYFQAHRGTYTTQARIKKGNRRSEIALREAEMWGAAAAALAGWRFPATAMDETWKQLLLCQFHDILPGSSIRRVCEEAEATQATIISAANETAAAAARALTSKAQAVTVFNSLSWERTALVPLPKGWKCAADAAGTCLPQQRVGGTEVVEVALPSCGWTTLRPCGPECLTSAAGDSACSAACGCCGQEPAGPGMAEAAMRGGKAVLENDRLRVQFNRAGEITSIFDKEAGREIAAGPCNAFRMYKDVPVAYDAWDINRIYEETPVALAAVAKVEVVESGPLVATLRIRRRIHESDLVQEVRLRRGSSRLDFVTRIDWRERHKLLKVAFPVDVHTNEAIHEIQFGHLRRPNHRSRPFDTNRFEVSAHKWTALAEEGRGAAVLNDCKYGVSVLANSINLTLLRSTLAPDMLADRGVQEFTYAFYVWNGSFADCGLVREGYDLNVPVTTAPGAAKHFADARAKGDTVDFGPAAAETASLFAVDAPNIVLDTVKPAEDGSGDLILRLYESKRMATRTTLSTALPVRAARETDMLEEPMKGARSIAVRSGLMRLDFRAFEIKTVRLKM